MLAYEKRKPQTLYSFDSIVGMDGLPTETRLSGRGKRRVSRANEMELREVHGN